MLLSIPPRPRSRPRLIPGLSLCGGDLIGGRYRVLSLLRADRACAYLAATQSGTNTRVEIQILLAMEDDVEPVHLRFLADARKAAVLQGPHVERILHVGVTQDGHPFVVREPHAGQTLASLLDDVGSLPTEAAVEIAIAICDALESAHAHGIVHGELDPTVVHVTWSADDCVRPGAVQLAGLGTSRALAMLPLDTRALAALAIRAPELLQLEREIDGRVDVWGVGVILYTMLAGAPPFAADSPSNVNLSVALDEPALLAGVPDGLSEIVDACLARDPTLRPQSATSLAARLATFSPNPLSVKRHSLLVLETGRYQALVLEQLVKEAKPRASLPPPAPLSAPPSSPPRAHDDDEPVLQLIAPAPRSPSHAPVAMTLPPAPPSRRWGRVALVAAACLCLAGGAVAASWLQSASAGASASIGTEAHKAPTTKAAAIAAPPAAAPLPAIAIAIADLPVKANADAKMQAQAQAKAKADAKADAKHGARGRAGVAANAKTEAAPVEDPVVRSAAAPIPPQPKAPDDDLRRFLDDRR